MISDHIQDRMKTTAGTPFWMAPEVIVSGQAEGYTCKADIWSLGITAYEMAVGHAPYQDREGEYQAIMLIVNEPPPRLTGKFSDALKDFVARCLTKVSQCRSGLSDMLARCLIRLQPSLFPIR